MNNMNCFINMAISWCGMSTLLLVSSINAAPEVAGKGSFPDIAVDSKGNIHLVYGRSSTVYYKKYDVSAGSWSTEVTTGVAVTNINRSDPDIVIDSKDQPHVFAGGEYAYWDGFKWVEINPKGGSLRDTELGIDGNDNLYLVYRGGNTGGFMGLSKRAAGSSSWTTLNDPDKGDGRNDHVYPDIALSPVDNAIHIVYRHGTPKKTAYRSSTNNGSTWLSEGITDNEPESPHLVVDYNNTVIAADGGGNVFKRTGTNAWQSEGRAVSSRGREQPELAVDKSNNIYCGSWGGKYNIRVGGSWANEKTIKSVTGGKLGFLEMAGVSDFAYAAWEEGSSVNADLGAGSVDIVVGKIATDGTVSGLGVVTFIQQGKLQSPLPADALRIAPNPFLTHTALSLHMPFQQQIDAVIYDVSGKQVQQLLVPSKEGGKAIFTWNGMDSAGNPVTAGLYNVIFTTPSGLYHAGALTVVR